MATNVEQKPVLISSIHIISKLSCSKSSLRLYGLVVYTHVITSRSYHGAGSRYVSFRRNATFNLRSVGLRDGTLCRNTTSKSRIVTFLYANVNKINANSH